MSSRSAASSECSLQFWEKNVKRGFWCQILVMRGGPEWDGRLELADGLLAGGRTKSWAGQLFGKLVVCTKRKWEY